MAEECEDVLALGANGLHLDVMDGRFVPNLTMGPKMVADLRRRFPGVFLDVHLMVERPEAYVGPFAEAGASHLTFHIEAALGRKEHHEHELIERIRRAGCGVGVALNPPTPADAVRHVAGAVDLVLVMSVFPGFAGQKFMPETLEKTRAIQPWMRSAGRLEMDGGINAENAAPLREAGCDTIVAASALFGAEDRAAMMRSLRG